MDKRLEDVLLGRESTEYILPFFWQHGEEHGVLAGELDAIERANIRAFCVESRTHEQFGEDKWWEDFGFLLAEARRRGLRVWLLDDKRFPTGYANGYVAAHPALRKTLIRLEWRDFAGPLRGRRLIPPPLGEDEAFVSIAAYRREENGFVFTGEGVDLLPRLANGLISWDVPAGDWRVYYVIRTHRVIGRENQWIDMLSPESCRAMLTAVYEPHYAHFAEYFGTTFAGFFSDEPRFGNDSGNYHSILGKPDMPLPWRDDLPARLAEASGMDEARVRLLLPALFHPYTGGEMHALRCGYMDVITKLYRENFSKLLGEWCRAHGVMYIGHVIEDMNAHQRLGYGAGHYFRSLEYQDMGGMDIVLQQIIPGLTERDHAAPCSGKTVDPEFFQYFLAKLPSSQAALTPRMQGRAMCEIYGAFGWAEGVPMMKQLTDHMIANGINYFVPHAFSPKFPDPDCPPHFYARGTNPQFGAFGDLMLYLRRCAHLITGRHAAPVALLYNAEAEWAAGENLLPQTLARALTRAQIDFAVLWEDALPRCAAAPDGLAVDGETRWRALVVPGSEFLTRAMIDDLRRLASSGVPVLVAGTVPRACEDGTPLTGALSVSPDALAAECRRRGWAELTVAPACPLVRYRRVTRPDGNEAIFLLSEDVFAAHTVTVTLPDARARRLYDPWTNTLAAPVQNGREISLTLPPSGAVFLVTDESDVPPRPSAAARPARLSVTLSARAVGEDGFTPLDAAVGEDAAALDGMDRFRGTLRYAGTLTLDGTERELALGEVGEIAEVTLNGVFLGRAVCPPYAVALGAAARAGENEITIDVIPNLGAAMRDNFSTYLPLPPAGLLGPVTVR